MTSPSLSSINVANHRDNKAMQSTNILDIIEGPKSYYLKAWQDFIGSFAHWRIFSMIGANDIRKRYSRSKLGQFWLTLPMAVHIATLGFVWSYLFKMQPSEYLPYLAVSIVFWTFILSCVVDGSNAYISATGYLRELNIPKLSYINSLFVKNIIILGHNILVLIPVYLVYSVPLSLSGIGYSLLGFLATSIFFFFVSTMLAMISLRFRDLPNIILSLTQIAFYVTPIMWKIELMPERFHKYIVLNPFAIFLSLCRDPLLGRNVSPEYWLAAFGYILLSALIVAPFFSKFRSRIVYWL